MNKHNKKDTIIIWVDGLEKFYEINKKDWLEHKDKLTFPQNEKGWGYSEHEYEDHKYWTWENKNEIKELINDLNK
tara:strand:+ start:512 stop:736 length:225 start_codon:yes stop_codon:yes gene_type:complete